MSTMSKLGLHIMNSYAGNLGTPRIVKLLDPSPEYILQVRQKVGAACTMVVRWYESEQPLDNPAQNARDWMAKHQAQMVDADAIYEGYNEVPDDFAPHFCAFEVERTRLMHGIQRRTGEGSFSVGTPDLPLWDSVYLPMLSAMNSGDALALHEYHANAADLTNQYHIGRWRFVPRLKDVPKVITECGRDTFTENGITWGYAGWHADPNCSTNAYLAELRGLNAIYAPDASVLGATVFTAGQITNSRWQPFEVNSIADIIVAEQDTVVVTLTQPALRHPLPWSRVSQPYGANIEYYEQFKFKRGHNGLDLAVPETCDVFSWHATPVIAAHDGKAVIVTSDDSYGVYVYIWGSWCDTLYAHLCEATLPASGQVKAGDLIGWVGYTGNVQPRGLYGTHLHFAVRTKPYHLDDGMRGYVDPAQYLVA